MKKGQGLSLNTIIIAAIVLIVLIVLWAIFTGRMGNFTKGINYEEVKAKEAANAFEKKALGTEDLNLCYSGRRDGTSCKCAKDDGTFNMGCTFTGKACGADGACPPA